VPVRYQDVDRPTSGLHVTAVWSRYPQMRRHIHWEFPFLSRQIRHRNRNQNLIGLLYSVCRWHLRKPYTTDTWDLRVRIRRPHANVDVCKLYAYLIACTLTQEYLISEYRKSRRWRRSWFRYSRCVNPRARNPPSASGIVSMPHEARCS
jgi:hypothetical protein